MGFRVIHAPVTGPSPSSGRWISKMVGSIEWTVVGLYFGLSLVPYKEGVGTVYVSPGKEFTQK